MRPFMQISGVMSSSANFIIARLSIKQTQNLLVITEDAKSAQITHDEVLFFINNVLRPNTKVDVIAFLGWDFSPYRNLIPSTSTRLRRLNALHKLSNPETGKMLVITSIESLAQTTYTPDSYIKHSLHFKKNHSYEFEILKKQLHIMGYQPTEPVEDPGTYSIRGGIIDIFSPHMRYPLRCNFFDTYLEDFRYFNPQTQRNLTIETPDSNVIRPVREFDCSLENLKMAREKIRQWADEQDYPKIARQKISDQLAEGILSPELDYLIPYLSPRPAFLWDYLPTNTNCIWLEPENIKNKFIEFKKKQNEFYNLCLQKQAICAHPDALFLPYDQILNSAEKIPSIEIASLQMHTDIPAEKIHYTTNFSAKEPRPNLDDLVEKIKHFLAQKYFICFIANSQAQLDRLAFLIAQRELVAKQIEHRQDTEQAAANTIIWLTLGSIETGFCIPEERLLFISEDEIFGKKTHKKELQDKTPKQLADKLSIGNLDFLQTGDLLVHAEHGIGCYGGLIKLTTNNTPGDFVLIEYAGADKLYIPIYRLEVIQKYVSPENYKPSLDKLGSQLFQKNKEKARAAIKDIAASLLKLYAQRAAVEGFAFPEQDEEFREFEATFPYDETPDQMRAIQDTITDMCKPRPMDRLVCGDVGYGKTEVAMRAAFKACQGGKQVAILAPTTILTEQHLQTFRARFQNYPYIIEALSRFRTSKEQKEIIQRLKEGKVDIIIGTHRLLSRDIAFKDLGLLIVDEEQRFGVEHKEKIKQLKVHTHALTLTATPIPRTLHMGLIGLKDISIIQTPPVDRQAIKTFLVKFNTDTIKSAIEAELARGGQVFFIHNRVQSISTIYKTLTELLPNVKIAVAHGQMPENLLEKVMFEFYHKQHDVLLCTSIIENGLDIPSANTIIVNRADSFGLSQLYQIRGRVGRSQIRAYAYFLIPDDREITEDAKKRLHILQKFVDLGSGFAIASHDLELRGGGDILGDAQSGHVSAIGYDMYLELLEEEIAQLKGEKVEKTVDLEINSPFPAFLPEDYVPDVRSRLSLYKRLSSLSSEEEIKDAEQEIRDRFGDLPPESKNLFMLLRIKLVGRFLRLKTINIGKQVVTILASGEPNIDPVKLLQLVRKEPKKYSLLPDSKFLIYGDYPNLDSVYDSLRYITQLIQLA